MLISKEIHIDNTLDRKRIVPSHAPTIKLKVRPGAVHNQLGLLMGKAEENIRFNATEDAST